jgi:hypothetical protein
LTPRAEAFITTIMSRRLIAISASLVVTAAALAAPAAGPLRVHPANPRYFTDGSGRAVYLTGSHTWNNLPDMGPAEPIVTFDFGAYLDFLNRHQHNFIRLWRWELTMWNTEANHEKAPRIHFAEPHPWMRTGPEKALDGKPRFDLSTFNALYFSRLRDRVKAANDRGVYVSIMLFEGWGLQFVRDGWKAHPFHPANNASGVGSELDPDGKGLPIYTLAHPAITRLQEAYVRNVIDTVNDFDNVLYEISNENHPPSTEWQYHFIRYIHDYERTRSKQHPVGMTFQYEGGANTVLESGPADWISPNPSAAGGFDYRTNPPAATGVKVVLSDTDHLWGIGGDVAWVWKSFLRGLNPLFMDPYKQEILSAGSDTQWEPVRRALGDTRRFAERLDLATLTPRIDLASTGFCLAQPGSDYLVYQPAARDAFTVDLKGGTYRFEWFNPSRNAAAGEGRVEAPGGPQQFQAPFEGDAVLWLHHASSP